jgi:hypothetical protein
MVDVLWDGQVVTMFAVDVDVRGTEVEEEKFATAWICWQISAATQAIGLNALKLYQRALDGIRATQRGEIPTKPRDPFCCGMPQRFFSTAGSDPTNVSVWTGKTFKGMWSKSLTARRRTRESGFLCRNGPRPSCKWGISGSLGFPRTHASGHIEPSSLQGQHAKACVLGKVPHFPLYTFRHTCLTRWAPFMDPWTLAYLAGHRDMSITKRYVHPQEYSTRAAIEKARAALGGHKTGHTPILNTNSQIANLAVSA